MEQIVVSQVGYDDISSAISLDVRPPELEAVAFESGRLIRISAPKYIQTIIQNRFPSAVHVRHEGRNRKAKATFTFQRGPILITARG